MRYVFTLKPYTSIYSIHCIQVCLNPHTYILISIHIYIYLILPSPTSSHHSFKHKKTHKKVGNFPKLQHLTTKCFFLSPAGTSNASNACTRLVSRSRSIQQRQNTQKLSSKYTQTRLPLYSTMGMLHSVAYDDLLHQRSHLQEICRDQNGHHILEDAEKCCGNGHSF